MNGPFENSIGVFECMSSCRQIVLSKYERENNISKYRVDNV